MKLRVAFAALLASSSMLSAQSVAPIAPIAPPVATNAMLRVGTEVPLKLSETLTTKGKRLHVGQRFRLQVADNVMVQGVPVIPSGSVAVGEITEVRNKGMWGKSGHFGARLLYVTVNGRQIRLSGAFDDKGVAGGVGAVAVSALVFLPAGFFMTGTSAQLPVGTAVKGFVDEDVPLSFASTAQQPLVVGAPNPVMTVGSQPGASAPAMANVADAVQLRVADTPSGTCIAAAPGYVGTGSASRPSVTTARPLCTP